MEGQDNAVMPLEVDFEAASVSTEGELPRASRIPFQPYKFRITAEPTFSKSKSSGNPMLTFECELVSPDAVVVDSVKSRVAGEEFKLYAVLAKGQTDNIKWLHKQNGLPTKLTFDPATGLPVGTKYTGMEFFATASSEESENTMTDEAGNEVVMLNPLTGKPITSSRRNISRVLPTE